MQKKLVQLLVTFWPILVLCVFSVLLGLISIRPGTFLVGWDSTMPELNLSANFQRILFAPWQEYRGLGTADGMAHGSNIIHWVWIALLSKLLPIELLRSTTILLLHLLGGIGLYALFTKLSSNKMYAGINTVAVQMAGLAVALLYQYNLITIQMFHIPLELFCIHFAMLPWSLWALFRYLSSHSRNDLLLFTGIQVAGLSQAHVPSIYIVYAGTIACVLLPYLLLEQKAWRQKIVAALNIIVTCIAVNAFWGIPYLLTTPAKAPVIAASAINQLSTDEIFLRNQAWGNLNSVLKFGGFNFDFVDWNSESNMHEQMMPAWHRLYSSKPYTAAAIALSMLGLVGAVLAITKKGESQYFFVGIGAATLFFFSMLAIDAPVIGSVSAFLRINVPFFHDIFRFTLTKFGIVYVCCLAIGMGVGLLELQKLIARLQILRRTKTTAQIALTGSMFVCLTMLTIPIWQNQFFYEPLQLAIPGEYFALRDYLNTQPKTARVLILPAPTLYGWTHTDWGYRGSGFLWQMIPQPTVDRAFDAWSAENEALYRALATAIRNNNPNQFDQVLAQYDISFILYDRSIFLPSETLDRFADRTESTFLPILEQPVWQKGKLSLYQYRSPEPLLYSTTTSQEITLPDAKLATSRAYFEFPHAVYSDAGSIYMPFPQVSDTLHHIAVDDKEVAFTTQSIPKNLNRIRVPGFSEQEIVQPVVRIRQSESELVLEFMPLATLDANAAVIPVWDLPDVSVSIAESVPVVQTLPLAVAINGSVYVSAQNALGTIIQPTLIVGSQLFIEILPAANVLTVESGGVEFTTKPLSTTVDASFWDSITTDRIYDTARSINDLKLQFPHLPSKNLLPLFLESVIENCDEWSTGTVGKEGYLTGLQLSATNTATACEWHELKQSAESSYLLHAEGKNSGGRGLKLFVDNQTTSPLLLEKLFTEDSFDEWFTLPATPNTTRSLAMTAEVRAFGSETAQSTISTLELIPYTVNPEHLARISLLSNTATYHEGVYIAPLSTTKRLGPGWYSAVVEPGVKRVVLSQSYDPLWILIQGKVSVASIVASITTPTAAQRYDEWAQSWNIEESNSSEIYTFVFLPSLLALILLPIGAVWVGIVLLSFRQKRR